MISLRLFSAALAVLSFFLGATPAHAYVTPDEFIKEGGGSAPENDADAIGNVPLPKRETPPNEPVQNVPLPQLHAPSGNISQPQSKVKAPSRKGLIPVAPVAPPLPENRKKEAQDQPLWQIAEEEPLRGTHSAAPEMPQSTATPLAGSGFPLELPFLLSVFGVLGISLLHRNDENKQE